jgi:hypothetical protein
LDKVSCDLVGRRVQRIPPRIVLRPLASYRVIFYLLLFLLTSTFVFGKSTFVAVLYLALGYTIYVCANAFVLHPIHPDADISGSESFHQIREKWN